MVKLFINAGADINKYRDGQLSLLTTAIKRYLYGCYHDGYIYIEDYNSLDDSSTYDLIQLLLDEGAEVNSNNRELPLRAAASFGAVDLVDLLIREGRLLLWVC